MKKLTMLIFTIFAGSVFAQGLYFPPLTGDAWETVLPETLGWNSDSLASLHDYLSSKNTKSFIILKDGKIVVEWYFGDFGSKKLWYWASAGKSLTAFLIGQAQEEGLLDIDAKTSTFLGQGWTALPPEKEDLITIRHQLTMTSGLDDDLAINACTLDSCLRYIENAGKRWAYHNAPYTLLLDVIENASGERKNNFTQSHVLNRIGMNGFWIKLGHLQLFSSNTRSMARYGLLIQNHGVWSSDTLLHDAGYFQAMTNTSQSINPSYGYLWWLNGKGRYMLPQSQTVFNTNLIPNAPKDVIAALGKNDQKLYISDSLGLVVVRLGDEAGQSNFALSSFDNTLWGKIISLNSTPTKINDESFGSIKKEPDFTLAPNYPNPFNSQTIIKFSLAQAEKIRLQVYTLRGELVVTLADGVFPAGITRIRYHPSNLSSGIYFLILKSESIQQTRKMIFIE